MMTLEPPLCRTISRNTTQVMLLLIKTLGLSGEEEVWRVNKQNDAIIKEIKKDIMIHSKKNQLSENQHESKAMLPLL